MIYLDNSATSFPKPAGMIKAMVRCMKEYCGNPGRSGHYMSEKTGEEVYKSRRYLAALFNIKESERLVFTSGTTEALNLGIKGILKEGDHAVTTSMEHNSVLRPLKALEKEGISHTIVPCRKDGSLDIHTLKKAIKENTKLIICTHASNVTGTIMPLDQICSLAHTKNIPVLADAAQSAGSVPLDQEKTGVDMIAFAGHKGLLGPLGTGALYVRSGLAPDPLIHGGTGTLSRETVQPRDFPEGYESGTVNAPGIIGLGYSVALVKDLGVKNIRSYEESLMIKLDDALRAMKEITVYGPTKISAKTAVTSFNIAGIGCQEVSSILDRRYGIAVRGGYHCAGEAHKSIGTFDRGTVRISLGPANTAEHIDKAIEAINDICKTKS